MATTPQVLLPQYAHDPAFQQRFRREAQAAASLSNPGVVAVYDTGMQDGTPFIVMEFVGGRTLKETILAEGPLHPNRAAEIAADVCSALAAAHARGLVHRDVKPPNVMLTHSSRVKLMDLGIARADAAESVTQTGAHAAMVGTALYLSPEQAQGQPVDPRSDLYSLGCCLYEMLTGTVPFRGATPVAVLYRHVREDPAPPRLLNPDVPAALEAVCLKALAKRPEDRYQTAVEMREDLERARAGGRVQAGRAAGPPTIEPSTTLSPLVQVPDVIGTRPPQARHILEQAGLQVQERRVAVNDPQQEGRVVFQQPPAGTTVRRGRVVTIYVGFRLGGG